MLFSFIEMWGLTEDGTFICKASIRSSLIDSIQNRIGVGHEDVYHAVLLDLQKVRSSFSLELQRFQFSILGARERGRRMLYLFQKDLMPGLNDMILESKG